MKKIAFIIQQYGDEINGGSELHCRQIAERLARYYDVEVLTTCSSNAGNWANFYPEGVSCNGNVTIRRYPVSGLRDIPSMLRLEQKIRRKTKKYNVNGIGWLKRCLHYVFRGRSKRKVEKICEEWIIAQGPFCPSLIDFLAKHEREYSCLLFFTYLYYPAVFGLKINPGKSIFIPTAHDEWALRMPIYKKIFSAPGFIMYNTEVEKKLVDTVIGKTDVNSAIAGAGISVPADIPYVDIKKELNIGTEYILFVGRVDVNKIEHKYFDWFLRYIGEQGMDVKLVLIGSLFMEIPESDKIISLGFVDEKIKLNAIKQSLFLFQPSKYESLSLVVLEAFAFGKPVLVQSGCEVMRAHVERSKGGIIFSDYLSFVNALDTLIANREANAQMGEFGKNYVAVNYQWESIINIYRNVIDGIIHE